MEYDETDYEIEDSLTPSLSSPQEGMKRRIQYDSKHLAPPTRYYWYGTLGRRWAGRGRKNPGRNWKYTTKLPKQWLCNELRKEEQQDHVGGDNSGTNLVARYRRVK